MKFLLMTVGGALVAAAACGGSAFEADNSGQGGNAHQAGTGSGQGGSNSSGGSAVTGSGGSTVTGSGGSAVTGSGGSSSNAGGTTSVAGSGVIGTAGAFSGAGANGTAGAAGAGGARNAPDCTTLRAEYLDVFVKARECDPAGGDAQCNKDYVLPNHCGCDMPANGLSSDYTNAQQKLSKFYEAGCEFDVCGALCVAVIVPSCSVSGDGYYCQ